MANFILHGISVCNDKDPSWINNRVKKLIHEQTSLCKDYHRYKNSNFWKIIFTEKIASGFGGIEG